MIAYRNLKIALWSIAILFVSLLFFSSCSRDLEVQTAYPFSLETMPIRKDIAPGETVEIRCKLSTPQTFADTRYSLRYLQYEGQGSIRIAPSGEALIPNNRYPIALGEFRLYYSSASSSRQSLELVFEDSHGQKQTLLLDFNAKDNKNEKTRD